MQQAEVDPALVFSALETGAAKSKALPFRYVAASRSVPAWEPQIDRAMQVALATMEKLNGSTIVLVDVSGSMADRLSAKSDLTRLDAAVALGILIRGICDDARIFTFSNDLKEVAPRQGMALADAIITSQPHRGTYLGQAVNDLHSTVKADRLIVITDEQSADVVGAPIGKGYMINVASYKNGIGYGEWLRISGFSESVVSYIAALEAA